MGWCPVRGFRIEEGTTAMPDLYPPFPQLWREAKDFLRSPEVAWPYWVQGWMMCCLIEQHIEQISVGLISRLLCVGGGGER